MENTFEKKSEVIPLILQPFTNPLFNESVDYVKEDIR